MKDNDVKLSQKDKSSFFDGRSSNKKANKGKNSNKEKRNIVLTPAALVLVTYVLLLLSKLIDLTLLNRDNEYMSIIILQLMIFILPGALWCRINGDKYISRLRIALPRPKAIPLMISATLLMISGGVVLSIIFGGTQSLSESFTLYNIFTSRRSGSASNAIYLILAYAVLPAICEEFIYRGILCCEYEKGSAVRAVILSSAFFALLHFELSNLPTYFFCGVILAMTLYATRSLIATIIVHLLYNSFALFGQPYLNRLYVLTSNMTLIIIIFVSLLFLSAALFCSGASSLYRKYLRTGESADYRKPVFENPAQLKTAFFEVIKDKYAIACLAVYIILAVIALF